jgi:predicted dehydrogenase
MYKAAVIGLGIGMAHVSGYMESEFAQLYAVCDLMPERLASVGGTFKQGSMLCLKQLFPQELLEKSWEDIGVIVYRRIEDLLNDSEIDIVSICTPDYLHPDHLSKVMASHKHIFLEKPLAIELQAASSMESEIRNYDRSFAIGYEFRVNPAIALLRELVTTGKVGKVEAFSLYHFRTPFRLDKWNHWIQRKECSGGLVIEETCHWFDLARFITGKEVSTVHCVTNDAINKDFNFEDIAYINGTFRDGGILQISHALTGFDFSLQLTVHGTEGTVWCSLKEDVFSSLDNGSSNHLAVVCLGKPGMKPKDAQVWTFGEEATEPFNIREMVKLYCRNLAEGKAQITGFDDAFESLRIAVGALQSAREKVVVQL